MILITKKLLHRFGSQLLRWHNLLRTLLIYVVERFPAPLLSGFANPDFQEIERGGPLPTERATGMQAVVDHRSYRMNWSVVLLGRQDHFARGLPTLVSQRDASPNYQDIYVSYMKNGSCKPSQLLKCPPYFFQSLAFSAELKMTPKIFYRINICIETGTQEKTRGQTELPSIQTIRLLSERHLNCCFGEILLIYQGNTFINILEFAKNWLGPLFEARL